MHVVAPTTTTLMRRQGVHIRIQDDDDDADDGDDDVDDDALQDNISVMFVQARLMEA